MAWELTYSGCLAASARRREELDHAIGRAEEAVEVMAAVAGASPQSPFSPSVQQALASPPPPVARRTGRLADLIFAGAARSAGILVLVLLGSLTFSLFIGGQGVVDIVHHLVMLPATLPGFDEGVVC